MGEIAGQTFIDMAAKDPLTDIIEFLGIQVMALLQLRQLAVCADKCKKFNRFLIQTAITAFGEGPGQLLGFAEIEGHP